MEEPGDVELLRGAGLAEDADSGSLRPSSFREFIGQAEAVSNLQVMIQAARLRGEPIEHLLFAGPPGLGKTTLARLIAEEMGTELISTAGPQIEHRGMLVAILSKLAPGQVLFIDEIHRLRTGIEETLYQAMEDYRVDITHGTGPGAMTYSLALERFTLVGATTRSGLLSAPLRDRFGVIFHLEFYNPADLTAIIQRAARVLDLPVDEDAARHIAEHSRGTPRVALRLLRRVRDAAQVSGAGRVKLTEASEALVRLGIGPLGLDRMDREILRAIIDRYDGGPVGLETLAAVFHEERDVLAEVHEPYLLKVGFLQKTPRGRVATLRAYEYFGLTPPRPLPASGELFDS